MQKKSKGQPGTVKHWRPTYWRSDIGDSDFKKNDFVYFLFVSIAVSIEPVSVTAASVDFMARLLYSASHCKQGASQEPSPSRVH